MNDETSADDDRTADAQRVADAHAATMRAATQEVYGPPAAIRVRSVPVPHPGPDEVLVRVRAAGVDAGTWHLATGRPYAMRAMGFGWKGPRSGVLGLAFSGVVETAGAGAEAWTPGDAVFGSAPGALAEYVVVKAADLVPVPAGHSFEEAAALPVSGVTALQAVAATGAGPGDRVLVIGAAGGVGHLAVQLAAARGARVTGLCSGGKAAFVGALGAEEVIDYATTDILALGRQYDAIIDTAGNRPLGGLRRILSPAGTLVLVGGEGGGALLGGVQRTVAAGLLDRFTRQRLVGLFARERTDDLRELARLVAAGALHPAIDTVYPLERTADAIEDLRAGRPRGKVIVVP